MLLYIFIGFSVECELIGNSESAKSNLLLVVANGFISNYSLGLYKFYLNFKALTAENENFTVCFQTPI